MEHLDHAGSRATRYNVCALLGQATELSDRVEKAIIYGWKSSFNRANCESGCKISICLCAYLVGVASIEAYHLSFSSKFSQSFSFYFVLSPLCLYFDLSLVGPYR